VKAVILAGGVGSRLSEETGLRPKPMVEIGGKPILWHIMKIFSAHGIDEFVICLGYKGYMIRSISPTTTCTLATCPSTSRGGRWRSTIRPLSPGA
jgi:choline kinase